MRLPLHIFVQGVNENPTPYTVHVWRYNDHLRERRSLLITQVLRKLYERMGWDDLVLRGVAKDMIDGEVGGNALADAPALDLRAESKDLACHVRHGMRFSFCSLGYLPQRSRYWSDTA